ncbi:hypothetical protein HGRIS_007935 [Hohenbuehelia grisea]|uniref:Rad21/Rec8-like protein N-terminal domain-containing protein n=1 Tax=Hohenbuehelia grisea TaxID=104357 RepID=A0ABR3J6T4_9AGAR
MFFTPELLERRDSGFGLLWLAATLGPKSTFKKLPRRDVMTADISQLCDLISEPAEPLALRLSSNLMVGVARVYKVKQEIFMTDVTTCFNALKRVVLELKTATDAQLEMAHPQLKESAVTLVTDGKGAMVFADFDDLVANWDEYLNLESNGRKGSDDEEDDFDPKSKEHGKQKPKAKPPSAAEHPRADLYTLQEHHDHLLSTSFDLSFNGSGLPNGLEPSSSQVEGAFGNDSFFVQGDDLDLGGAGDDLARELGEGWGASPAKDLQLDNAFMDIDPPFDLGFEAGGAFIDANADFGFVAPFSPAGANFGLGDLRTPLRPGSARTPIRASSAKRKAPFDAQKENSVPRSKAGTPRAMTPTTEFTRLLLSQETPQPLTDTTALHQNQDIVAPTKKVKGVKRTRLLLDARTELTDDELKNARAQYLQGQVDLKHEQDLKKAEQASGKIIDEFLWGVPRGIQAPELAEFWQENFRVQVEARTGALHIHPPDEQAPKRRKIRAAGKVNDEMQPDFPGPENLNDMNWEYDGGMQFDAPMLGGELDPDVGRLRSSEEPGQGRNASRPPSVFGDNFGFDAGLLQDPPAGSQRSSLFPWDNAGPSSSNGGGFGPLPGSDMISIDKADIRIRGTPLSKRGGSLVPSQLGSLSPALVPRSSQFFGEDYVFDVDPQVSQNVQNVDTQNADTQQSDMNVITLERNSLNFLEYTRMQLQTLPVGAAGLAFDTIVPKASSTRHVAAAAFYHCLGECTTHQHGLSPFCS